MSKNVTELNSGERERRYGRIAFWAMAFTAALVIAACILLDRFGLTGAKRHASNETPVPVVTEAPATAGPNEPTPAGETVPPTDPVTGEPTPAAGEYVRTAIMIDGRQFLTLASRQAAEEVLNAAVAHFDRLCPGTVRTSRITNSVELVEAQSGATVSFDQAYAALIAEDSPLKVSTVFVQDEVSVIRSGHSEYESDRYYVGTRFVASYGRDGKKLLVHEYTFINGVQSADSIKEERVLSEAVPERIIIGSRPIPEDVTNGRYALDDCPEAPFEFIPPTGGRAVKYFGFYGGVLHRGVDFASAQDGQCFAAHEGVVIAVLERGALGKTVDVLHEGGFTTRYAHLSEAFVSVGDKVEAGGRIGSTRDETLHFEVLYNGRPVNPLAYIPGAA